MKRQILFLILSISAFLVKGQAYNSMLSDSSVWYITKCFEICSTDMFYTSGDTIIEGKHYYKYYKRMSRNNILYAFLREETENKKVYFKGNHSFFDVDTTEFVLYDFNLKLGDSILWISPTLAASSSIDDSHGWHDYYKFKLDTIGWAKVNEVSTYQSKVGNRLQVRVTKIPLGGGTVYGATWIESFGFSEGDYDGLGGHLNCFYRNDVKEFEGYFYTQYNDCDYTATGIKTFDSDNLKIINDDVQLRIIINDFLCGVTILRIIDINGRVVKMYKTTSSETIVNISDLVKGIYIVSLEYNDKRVSRKIIK